MHKFREPSCMQVFEGSPRNCGQSSVPARRVNISVLPSTRMDWLINKTTLWSKQNMKLGDERENIWRFLLISEKELSINNAQRRQHLVTPGRARTKRRQEPSLVFCLHFHPVKLLEGFSRTLQMTPSVSAEKKERQLRLLKNGPQMYVAMKMKNRDPIEIKFEWYLAGHFVSEVELLCKLMNLVKTIPMKINNIF